MFYLGVLLIFMGFSPVSQYVDDLMYVRNQPLYNYNEYYDDDDYLDDLLDSEHHGHDINFVETNYNYGYNEPIEYNQTSIGSAIFGLILIGLGTFLIIKSWKKPHGRHSFWRIFGIVLGLYGLYRVLSDTLIIGSFYYETIPGRVIVALRYLIPGALLYFYNRKELPAVQEQPEITQEAIVNIPNTPIERLVYKLEEAKKTSYSLEHPELEQNLNNSIDILREIYRSDYKIEDDFLEQIASLTDTYLEVCNNKIQNQRSSEVLNNIANTYSVVNEALENIYDSNFEEKANEIESENITLQTKLSLDGKLDSPFEKFKENYQNKN